MNTDTDECLTAVGHRIEVPDSLRIIARQTPRTRTLHQVGEDIWTTYSSVEPHIDSTADGLITYGLIIENDPNYIFFHGTQEHAIPPGTLYRMNGRIVHGTRGGPGLLAALIWDMPPVWSLTDFAVELMNDCRSR